jgi:hypothetical protein
VQGNESRDARRRRKFVLRLQIKERRKGSMRIWQGVAKKSRRMHAGKGLTGNLFKNRKVSCAHLQAAGSRTLDLILKLPKGILLIALVAI